MNDIQRWADHFALLGERSRLALLLRLTTVSQALRLLRAHELVHARREGRTVLYELAEHRAHALLGHVRTGRAVASR